MGLGPGEQRHHPHHHVQGPGNHEGELLRGRGDAQKIKLGQYLSFILELPRKKVMTYFQFHQLFLEVIPTVHESG